MESLNHTDTAAIDEAYAELFAMNNVSLAGRNKLEAYDRWAAGSTLYHGTYQSLANLGGWTTRNGVQKGQELQPMQPYQWIGQPPKKEPYGQPAVCMTSKVDFAASRSLLHADNPILVAHGVTREVASISNSIQTATGESFFVTGYDTVKTLYKGWTQLSVQEKAVQPSGLFGTVCFVDKKWGHPVSNRDPGEYRAYMPVPIKGLCTVSLLDLSDDLVVIHGDRSQYIPFLTEAKTVVGGYEAIRDFAVEKEIGVALLGEIRERWLAA